MPDRVTITDFPLGPLFRRFAGNFVIFVVFVAAAIGLMRFDAVVPRPSAPPEITDPPGSGLIVRSEVICLWVPEILVDPVGHELPAPVARTQQELKKFLERRGQANLWYAITVRTHLADDRAEVSSFVRYPHRQPEYLPELMDVLATVAGSPPRDPSADYSAAIVHIVPAGFSQQEWLEAVQAPTVPRLAVPNEPEPKQ